MYKNYRTSELPLSSLVEGGKFERLFFCNRVRTVKVDLWTHLVKIKQLLTKLMINQFYIYFSVLSNFIRASRCVTYFAHAVMLD